MWMGDHSRYLSLHSSATTKRGQGRGYEGRMRGDRKGYVRKRKPARLRSTSVSFSRVTGIYAKPKQILLRCRTIDDKCLDLETKPFHSFSNISPYVFHSLPLHTIHFQHTTNPCNPLFSCRSRRCFALIVFFLTVYRNKSVEICVFVDVWSPRPPTSPDPSSTLTSSRC
jgi:hypothetical protein